MASIITCDSKLSAFTGIVGMYVFRCDTVASTCALTFSFEPVTEESEIGCNNTVSTVSDVVSYNTSMSMNFNIHALSALLGIDLVPIVSLNGVTGRGLKLPLGTLPRGIGFVAISRSDNQELHVRGTDSNLTSFNITELSRGSVVTVEFSLSTPNLELLEYDGIATPDTSPFLNTFSPYYSWFVCDCESGDTIQDNWPDHRRGNPLRITNAPIIAVKNADNCCGMFFDVGQFARAEFNELAAASGEFGVIGQFDLTNSNAELITSPDITVGWDVSSEILTVTNPAGTVTYPVMAGPLTFGYSNDGTVLINGDSLAGLLPSVNVPAHVDVMTNGGGAILYSFNVYDRWINVSDVT